MSKEISSRIIRLAPVKWADMKFIQDDDFKVSTEEEYQKVAKSLVSNNWVAPFYVWQDSTGQVWCLDGKRREIVLRRIKELGGVNDNGLFKECHVPDELPALFIDAESKEAAAKLVLQYSSAFGTITQEGLYGFLQAYDIDYSAIKDEISLPDFSMPRFEQKFDIYGLDNANDEPTNDVAVSIGEDVTILVVEGDIFQLGKHRLICGNCLDPDMVNLLMEGNKARILCTDPPYNLSYREFGGKGNVQHEDFVMAAGEMSDEQFVEFMASIMKMACDHTVDGSIHGIFMDFRHSWHMGEAARQVYGSPIPKQMCVWDKMSFANGSFYRAQYELCFFYKNGKAKHLSHLELVDRTRTNVWKYPGINSFSSPDRQRAGGASKAGALADHPTPKNSDMIADMLLDLTNDGDIVFEPFSGSGTCIIAGERTRRKVYAMEIEPKYVQAAILRYRNFCDSNNLPINFAHLNGNLTLDKINDASAQHPK